MPKNKIAAIIPAHNEAKTVGEVVRVAKSSDLLDEVIVVSDGSTDKTAEAARRAGARVFELKPNRGKGGAMAYGAEKTAAEIILFLDADLRGFRAEHIKLVLTPIIRGERVMNAGLIDRGRFISRFMPHLPLLSGERAMLRFVFERVPEMYRRGFMIETALNYYCRSRHLPYGSVLLRGLNMRKKIQKVGIWRGLWQYVKMSWAVARAMVTVRWAHKRGKF